MSFSVASEYILPETSPPGTFIGSYGLLGGEPDLSPHAFMMAPAAAERGMPMPLQYPEERYQSLRKRLVELDQEIYPKNFYYNAPQPSSIPIQQEPSMIQAQLHEMESQMQQFVSNELPHPFYGAPSTSSMLPSYGTAIHHRPPPVPPTLYPMVTGSNPPDFHQGSAAKTSGGKRPRGRPRKPASTTRRPRSDEESDLSPSEGDGDQDDDDYAPPRKLARNERPAAVSQQSSDLPVRRSSRPKRASTTRPQVATPEPPRKRRPPVRKIRKSAETVEDTPSPTPAEPSPAAGPSSSTVPATTVDPTPESTISPPFPPEQSVVKPQLPRTIAPTSSEQEPASSPVTPLPSSGPTATTTTTPTPVPSVAGINPYMSYYSPNAVSPITPNSAPLPFNPYYYLAGFPPMAMFPPSAGPGVFVPGPPPQPTPAKNKRLKAPIITSKSYNIPNVPRDKTGKPMLPLNVGIMTLICLGEICVRQHFHSERYIFPVGYEVSRRYLSSVDPRREVVYHCTILDGGDGPKFQIVPSDTPDKPVIAGTATGAWSSIVKQANTIRNRQHSNSVSGPDFFGLGQNTIKHLLQQLPNADKLKDYVWQHFVEGGPLGGRHAAVIPALPEEYHEATSMSVGVYYPDAKDKPPNDPASAAAKRSHYPPHLLARALKQQEQAPPSTDEQQGQDFQNQPTPSPLFSTTSQDPSPIPNTSDIFNMQAYQNDNNKQDTAAAPSADALLSSSVSFDQPHNNNNQSVLLNGNNSNLPVPPTFASIMNAFPPAPASLTT